MSSITAEIRVHPFQQFLMHIPWHALKKQLQQCTLLPSGYIFSYWFKSFCQNLALTVEGCVNSQASPWGIYDEQRRTETGFSPSTLTFLSELFHHCSKLIHSCITTLLFLPTASYVVTHLKHSIHFLNATW
jgi:hypothetical protein